MCKARTKAEADQSAAQDGFVYEIRKLDGSPPLPVTANQIDNVLLTSKNLDERRVFWELSKTIGTPLRSGLLKLRDLRNKCARELGFDDFFALQVADYGMTVPDMIARLRELPAPRRIEKRDVSDLGERDGL